MKKVQNELQLQYDCVNLPKPFILGADRRNNNNNNNNNNNIYYNIKPLSLEAKLVSHLRTFSLEVFSYVGVLTKPKYLDQVTRVKVVLK